MPSPLPEVDPPQRCCTVDDAAVTLTDVHEDDQHVVG
jgi:hypothetical protein